MSKRIVYQVPDGSIAVIVPAPSFGLTVSEIAAKDVPAGLPYRIVDVNDIPVDRTFRAAWEADLSSPDGEGADFGAGSDWAVIDIDFEHRAVLLRHELTGEIAGELL